MSASPAFRPQNPKRTSSTARCHTASVRNRAQAEHEHGEREHAEDAEHRGVAVVAGEQRADLEVGHDRQVDQEPKTPAPTKFQKPTAIRKKIAQCARPRTASRTRRTGRSLIFTKSQASRVSSVSGTTSSAEKAEASPSRACPGR